MVTPLIIIVKLEPIASSLDEDDVKVISIKLEIFVQATDEVPRLRILIWQLNDNGMIKSLANFRVILGLLDKGCPSRKLKVYVLVAAI